MSIYDGLCDVGSETANRCPAPATNYSNQHAWCSRDGRGVPLGSQTWPEVVAAFEARKAAIVRTINEAEQSGQFLFYEDDVISPAEARRILRNGWTISSLSAVNPREFISGYEREAQEAADEAASLRAKARKLKGQLKRQEAKRKESEQAA